MPENTRKIAGDLQEFVGDFHHAIDTTIALI